METIKSDILTVPEVAKYLKMSKSKLYYLIQSGQIPCIKIGRNVRIKESVLQKWLEEQSIPETSDAQLPQNIRYQ